MLTRLRCATARQEGEMGLRDAGTTDYGTKAERRPFPFDNSWLTLQVVDMVAVNSTMLPLGTQAPDFRLPDPGGKVHSLADFKGAPALLVVFMCNHCPYVKHIRDGLARLARDYRPRGGAGGGINAHDAGHYFPR